MPFFLISPSHSKYKDYLDNLKAFGWKLLDVDGDGNCGYYAILLGLENIGNMDYHPQMTSTTDPRRGLNMWQSKLVKLHQDLSKHSQKLVKKNIKERAMTNCLNGNVDQNHQSTGFDALIIEADADVDKNKEGNENGTSGHDQNDESSTRLDAANIEANVDIDRSDQPKEPINFKKN
ncbi:hypothetical protein G9A89_000315 [Geosiphon pyriformis]|nr:hypothetical protein G9A89_000315 [Geosiphon pyriformis]